MELITGFKKVQYGDYEYFNPNATPSEILTQMPKKLKKLIKKAGIRKMSVWDIDMKSFTIIFKAADLIGGPAEDRATIGFKVNLLTPVFDGPEPTEQECAAIREKVKKTNGNKGRGKHNPVGSGIHPGDGRRAQRRLCRRTGESHESADGERKAGRKVNRMSDCWMDAMLAVNILELICLFGILIIIAIRADKGK